MSYQGVLTPDKEREFRELERQGRLPKKINRFGDSYLKFLLAAPERKWLLLDLLNAIMSVLGYETMSDIKPTDRELSPDISDGKGIRLDYLGTTPSGRKIDLEFQKRRDEEFIKRALFCGSSIIHRQLESGSDYHNIRQTIFIGLLDFTLFDEEPWYWDFLLANLKSGKILTSDLLLIFIEMKKLTGLLDDLRKRVKRGEFDGQDPISRLMVWGGYVTSKGVDIVSEVMTQDKVFTEVMKAENDYWGNSRNRYIQYLEEKHERDALSVITSAERRGEAKGLAKGLAKGEAKGLAKGEAKGLAKGEAKGLAKGKAEIAKNLLSLGVDYETIIKATGMSVTEIESLRDK